MKVWLIAVLLAVAVAATSVAGSVIAETELAKSKNYGATATDPETEADAEVKDETVGEEESESKGKDEDKDEGSNESSSEENEEENEEEESSTKAAEEVTTVKVIYAPVVYTTVAYVKPAYVPPTAAPPTYNKVNYVQVPGPVYKPVVTSTTTEAPKPLAVTKPEIYVPPVVERPKFEPKYLRPIVTAVVETTTKSAPIVFDKPSSAPLVTVRKSGWVRAPGYKLGYARSESISDPAVVVETPKTVSAVVSSSKPVVAISQKSDDYSTTAKTTVVRQSYPQWFFKPKSAIAASN